ncbi:MAG: polyphosphate polymerase domain-containing protein [Bacteroidetes bacterium]|nr:polyphosphate polymerase domain-containing protein [Bacteroidota bacterium]
MDTKFSVHKNILPDLLKNLINDYQILEIGENRLMTYSSTYFDTPELSCYKDHHNSRVNRIKIRIRNYVESGIYFLEIKKKTNQGNTLKKRIDVNNMADISNEKSLRFINKNTSFNETLIATLTNGFNRFTLVNIERNERVTIDTNIAYNGIEAYPNLAIIELKQSKLDRSAPLFDALRKMHVTPNSISKYCIGMATLNPELKQNNFKRKISALNKLSA